MRLVLLALAAGLAGCSYEVTTPDLSVYARPSPELAIGVDPSSVQVLQEDRNLAEYRDELYQPLLAESGGAVAAGVRPLNLSATLRFEGEDEQGSVFLGVFSLFLFPLAFVPETPAKSFHVSYALRDRQNQVVYERTLEGKIEGSFKGFYIARINANRSLYDLEKKSAAKNAARMILQDVFSRSADISASLRRLRAETASESAEPAAEPKAAAQPAAWWQK